jgi:5-methylcytosine-specific restriction enzyme A
MGRLSNKYYGNQLWRRARINFLAEHPLCVMCEADSKIEPANVVDHIIPHKGDQELFWAQGNWQALCRWHHNVVKRSHELHKGADEDGWPTDAPR